MAKQKKTKCNEKMRMWQDRISIANTEWADEVANMDHREGLYNGEKDIDPVVEDDDVKKASHVRNVIF